MPRPSSFGEALRMGRERKGLSVDAVARRLHIRADIVDAIECGDFAHMPPQGYTANMVGAYARLVGLNPSEVTRAYRDEAYQHDTGRRPLDIRSERSRSQGSRASASSRGASSRPRSRDLESSRYGGSASRSDRTTSSGRSQRTGAGLGGYGASRNSRSQTLPPSQPSYTSLVQGQNAPSFFQRYGNLLPFVAGGLIVILIIVLIVVLLTGNNSAPEDDTPIMPVSGMPSGNTENGSGDQATADTTPVAPTSATLTFEVADGKDAYIEVIEDDKTTLADEITGPKTEEYKVTGTLRIKTTNPENVTVKVDGETVELTHAEGSSVYSYTLNFDDYLDKWRQDNNVADSGNGSSSDSSGNAGSSKLSSATNDDSGSSDSSDSSGSSRSSSGDSAGEGSSSSDSNDSGNSGDDSSSQ